MTKPESMTGAAAALPYGRDLPKWDAHRVLPAASKTEARGVPESRFSIDARNQTAISAGSCITDPPNSENGISLNVRAPSKSNTRRSSLS